MYARKSIDLEKEFKNNKNSLFAVAFVFKAIKEKKELEKKLLLQVEGLHKFIDLQNWKRQKCLNLKDIKA